MNTMKLPAIQQVRLVSVKAERPNHPSRSHARQGGVVVVVVGSQLGGGGGLGGGFLHDNDIDTYMTPLGRFDIQSRSA